MLRRNKRRTPHGKMKFIVSYKKPSGNQYLSSFITTEFFKNRALSSTRHLEYKKTHCRYL